MPSKIERLITMNLTEKMTLTEAARHRTAVAGLAAAVSHDLGNMLTLIQTGFPQTGAGSTLAQEGVARLAIYSDVIAALDRGGTAGETMSLLQPAVYDAIGAIRGAFDIDLSVQESRPDGGSRCNAPKAQLTAAVYAALDGAARAAQSVHPVRVSWIDDPGFAGIRIDVNAVMRVSRFDSPEPPGKHRRPGLEQALALTHKFGGYGLHVVTGGASQVALRWRKAGIAADAGPSGAPAWFGAPPPDVLSLVPAVANWPVYHQLQELLDNRHGIPCALLGLVTPEWNDRSLLESLRWMRAAGSMLLPLVSGADAKAFIAEEFGGECLSFHWPVELKKLSDFATRLNSHELPTKGFER